MKVPEPRLLPSGNYFIQLRLNGESIPITAESATECRIIAEHTKAKYRFGNTTIKKTPKEITLSEACTKYINANKATLAPTTVRNYTIYSRTRFTNYKDKKLSEIKWQKMIDDELDLVSEKTVKNAWALVSPSLKHVGYPVPEVRLSQVPVNEIPFLQPEEIGTFCKFIKGRPYEIAALLLLHGLRLSEARGLTWANIDLSRDVITVKGAMVQGLDGDVMKDTNKTKQSTRPVPIMIPQLHDALDAEKKKRKPKDTDYVVLQKDCTILNDIKRASKMAGVTEITPHGLRHSFASLCFFLEIPSKQIQEWGGWKNDSTLQRIYIRLAASAKAENQTRFANFFKFC